MSADLSSGRKSFLSGLMTCAAALAFIFLAIEIIFRAVGIEAGGMPFRRVEIKRNGTYTPASAWGTAPLKQPSPYPGVAAGEYVPDLEFRFVYASNPRGYFDAENAVEARINNLGLRGPDTPVERIQGTTRTLLLGDSFTFGEGVREEDSFAALLGPAVTSRKGGRHEVINAGVSSYNTADEITYLEQRWLELRPDLVVIIFVINDAYDDSVFGPLHKGYVEGLSRVSQSGNVMGSRSLAWVYDRYSRIKIGRETARVYESQFSDDPLIPGHNWNDCKDSLERAGALAGQEDFKLALVIFPELFMLNERYPFTGIHNLVRSECEALDIPVLDLFDAFEGEDASTLWVHPTDHHPNETAHRIAAEAIAAFVSDEQLIP